MKWAIWIIGILVLSEITMGATPRIYCKDIYFATGKGSSSICDGIDNTSIEPKTYQLYEKINTYNYYMELTPSMLYLRIINDINNENPSVIAITANTGIYMKKWNNGEQGYACINNAGYLYKSVEPCN